MKVYKCDADLCHKQSDNAEGWLTIGSTDGKSLTIINQLPECSGAVFQYYNDLHFCSKKCFLEKVFKENN